MKKDSSEYFSYYEQHPGHIIPNDLVQHLKRDNWKTHAMDSECDPFPSYDEFLKKEKNRKPLGPTGKFRSVTLDSYRPEDEPKPKSESCKCKRLACCHGDWPWEEEHVN